MSEQVDQLRVQFQQLRELAGEVAQLSGDAAEQLVSAGIPPQESYLQQLQTYIAGFRQFRDTLISELAELPSAERLSGDDITLADLEEGLWRVRQLREREEQARQTRAEAINVIRQVLNLQSTDGSPVSPLDDVRQQAEHLQVEIEEADGLTVPDAAIELTEGTHPLCALVALALHADELDDEQWTAHYDTLTARFGRPLATALARGRVAAAADSAGTPPEPAIEPAGTTEHSGE